MSTEDAKLRDFNIGLINVDDEMQTGVYKIKLNLSEIKEFSLFEGQLIVCAGFAGENDKFNVNQIYYP